MSTRGAVAAGHPLTAEAGADVLRGGGNAVDAAVAAVLTSFVTESPLTGLGAGGFMLVHAPEENVLLDFFVAVPGRDGIERRSELDPVPVYFSEDVPQIFNVGAASCGVPGTAAGLCEALQRYGLEGPEPFCRGEIARAVSEWVVERGGTLGVADLASYEPIARYPARGGFRGRDVLTNPPPSSGGILVAFGLDLLDRLG